MPCRGWLAGIAAPGIRRFIDLGSQLPTPTEHRKPERPDPQRDRPGPSTWPARPGLLLGSLLH